MTQPHRPVAAALWMLGSIVSFSLMAIAGRIVAATHDTFELLGYRSIVTVAILVAFAAWKGRLSDLRTRNLAGHLTRNTMHFVGQNLWFWSLTAIPLAQVFALEFTAPIWVILLSAVFLGEALTRWRLMAAVLGFAGTLVVAQPDFRHIEPGALAAAGSALFFAATIILTKRLTRGETVLGILFWLGVMQAALGLAAAAADLHMTLPTWQSVPWLVLLGAVGFFGHFCVTSALSLAPAGLVMPIDFGRLPLIAVVGAVFWGESITLALLAGAALIVAGNWLNLRAPAGEKVSA